MAELTGKAISELPESTSVSDAALVALSQNGASKKMTLSTLLGGLVKKIGDTMTGNLTIAKSAPGVYAKNTELQSDVTVSSATNSVGFRVLDKNEHIVALFTDRYAANGRTGAWMSGYKWVNGSNLANSLYLYVDGEGNRVVEVSYPAAWRSALNLGTVAIEDTVPASKGGTGQTSLDTFSINRQTAITTAPSSDTAIMSYKTGFYRVGISGTQSIFPANYGVLEIIRSDTYGLARFTKVNSTTPGIWIRSFNTNTSTWYENEWKVVV